MRVSMAQKDKNTLSGNSAFLGDEAILDLDRDSLGSE